MNALRAATAAEIESIKDQSDLDPTCVVVALDTPRGAVLGVIRRPVELDPVFYPPALEDRYKVIFARDIATGLMFQGVTHFYFNAPADDEKWRSVIEKWGAEAVSPNPEIRYKKVVYSVNQEKDKADNRLQ